MITASDMRAMRRAIEHVEEVSKRPAAIRKYFVPRDSVVRLAVEIANQGGRVSRVLPDDYNPNGQRADGVVGLMASGWLHWFPTRGWELDGVLLSAFAHEVLQ